MLFRKSLIITFAILFFSNTNAQEFKLGKVSIAELQEKVHPKDTSAVAAILFKKGETRFEYSNNTGFDMVTEVSMRIKIYKKEGYNWASRNVGFRAGSSPTESVNFTDAVTYNLVAGKIEKTKLKSEGEFVEKVDKYWNRKKITMPNVKEGSVIEYRYVLKSTSISSIRDWYFQANIPINVVEYSTYIPEYFIFNSNQKGFVFPKIKTDNRKKNITLNGETATDGTIRQDGRIFSNGNTVEYEENETTYLAENVPAMKDEAYINNIDNYTSILSQELSMTRYPGKPLESFSTNWDAVVKTIYEFEDFGPELNKTGYFENDLKPIIEGLTTPEEKISAILDYVKSTVKWNDYYGFSCDDGVKNAYKVKTGNIAEINLMLTAMLRYAGLTANPVLVSTRSNGIAAFPNLNAFNYVIAAVENGSSLILLDASDKFSTPNTLPLRALNWTGRLIRKDGTSAEVDLMPKLTSNNTVMMSYSIDEKGGISGKIRRQKTDYEALIFRTDNESIKEENYLEKLENENGKIEISDYSRTNEKDIKLPVTETLSFSGSNLTEIIGGKIYLNPMLFFSAEKNPFRQEIREFPVDYGYPSLGKYMINIQIPDGYKVETIPASSAITMEDNLGSFKYIVNNSGNGIQISVLEQINSAIIPSEYYSMLKDFYKGIITKQNEKIVLTKNQ